MLGALGLNALQVLGALTVTDRIGLDDHRAEVRFVVRGRGPARGTRVDRFDHLVFFVDRLDLLGDLGFDVVPGGIDVLQGGLEVVGFVCVVCDRFGGGVQFRFPNPGSHRPLIGELGGVQRSLEVAEIVQFEVLYGTFPAVLSEAERGAQASEESRFVGVFVFVVELTLVDIAVVCVGIGEVKARGEAERRQFVFVFVFFLVLEGLVLERVICIFLFLERPAFVLDGAS